VPTSHRRSPRSSKRHCGPCAIGTTLPDTPP
jgi:hypothetical protein